MKPTGTKKTQKEEKNTLKQLKAKLLLKNVKRIF